MAEKDMEAVIIRAVSEEEFRDLLFDDPDKAMEGYDLSEDEADKLKSLKREKFDANLGELEERILRAGFTLGNNPGNNQLWGDWFIVQDTR